MGSVGLSVWIYGRKPQTVPLPPKSLPFCGIVSRGLVRNHKRVRFGLQVWSVLAGQPGFEYAVFLDKLFTGEDLPYLKLVLLTRAIYLLPSSTNIPYEGILCKS